MAEGQQNIHEDIKWLEEQLGQKKRELAEKSTEQKEEREIVRDVLSEVMMGESAPPPPPPTSSSISDDEAKEKAAQMVEMQHHEVIDNLVNIAFSKDLASALKVAEKLKNPHLLDEFHDTLADEYYQKLLDARRIK